MIDPRNNHPNKYRWPEDTPSGQPTKACQVAQEDFSKTTAMTVGGPVAVPVEDSDLPSLLHSIMEMNMSILTVDYRDQTITAMIAVVGDGRERLELVGPLIGGYVRTNTPGGQFQAEAAGPQLGLSDNLRLNPGEKPYRVKVVLITVPNEEGVLAGTIISSVHGLVILGDSYQGPAADGKPHVFIADNSTPEQITAGIKDCSQRIWDQAMQSQ